ncbi:hypothetical protein FB446DRAFT_749996 [Lentinula raphanica]|nr:hypothetical protein FB446DRAFT_749996 [Lentinula raphanica]
MRLNYIYVLLSLFAVVYAVPIPGNILSGPSKSEPNSEQHTSKSESLFKKLTSPMRWFSSTIEFDRNEHGTPIFRTVDKSKPRTVTSYIKVEIIGEHAAERSKPPIPIPIHIPDAVSMRIFMAIWNKHGHQRAFKKFRDANSESLPIYYMNSYKGEPEEQFGLRYWTSEHVNFEKWDKYVKVDLGCTPEKPCEGLIDKEGVFITHEVVSREKGKEGEKAHGSIFRWGPARKERGGKEEGEGRKSE